MTTKKDLVIVALLTFCLTVTLFMILPTRSQTGPEYDPWTDLNDDGVIDSTDLGMMGAAWGSYGTPMNKTALLLELQSRIDSLNDSLLNLEAYLEARIDSLNGTVQSLDERIGVLEYNFSTLNPYVISYNSTYSDAWDGTTETLNWVDMSSTSVGFSLNTTCYLLIMFSADSYNNNGNADYVTYIQALVDSTVALPGGWITLTPSMSNSLGNPYVHRHYITTMAYSYNFYEPSVPAGNHTIKIQWRVTGGTGYVFQRTLTVLALPVQ